MALFEQIKETVGLKKEAKPQFLWTVYLGTEQIGLALVKLQQEEFEILQTATEKIDEKKGLAGLTQTLKEMIQDIDFEEKPKRVFFGVSGSWLEEGELKKPHREALEKLVKDLGLIFSGFVSSLEAAIEFYHRQEGVPPNIIFLEAKQGELRVTVCQKGKVVKDGQKEIKESLGSTLESLLVEDFTGESLPSRIVIFDHQDFEKIRGEILSYPFEETGFFLHLPKVESISEEDLLKGISFLARQSLGGEAQRAGEAQKKEQPRFGFVVDHDVSQKIQKIPPPPKEEKPPLQKEPVKRKISLPAFSLTKISGWLQQLSFPSFQIGSLGIQKPFLKPTFFVGGGVILVLLVVFLAYWHLPRAEITIFVEPRNLKETMEIVVASEGFEASESAKVLEGKLISTDVSGELSAQATGTKLTGEKAAGRITIFNKTLSAKSFLQGTAIIGPNDLKFTLDSPVSIDPATISTSAGSETKTYGKAEVSAAAQTFGSEYNLPGGIDFSFADFSDTLYSAYSAEGFSGGSSQEVTVVASEDQEKLEQDLTDELKQKAKQAIQDESGKDLKIFPEAITLEVKTRNFDHDMGEETETVNLALEAVAETLGFSEDSLRELLTQEIEERVPEEFELVPNQIETQERFKERHEESLVIEVEFEVHLLPKLELEKIKKRIAGKKTKVAQDYLSDLPRVAGAQITLWPPLPSFLLTVPHRVDRISIEIRPE